MQFVCNSRPQERDSRQARATTNESLAEWQGRLRGLGPKEPVRVERSDEALLRFFVQERIISTNYAKKQLSGWMGPGA